MEQDVVYDSSLKYLTKLFKEKGSRADVAVRAKLNKESEFTVIKTTYNSFCRPAAKSLQKSLEKCLFDVNKAILEAYSLANLHVIRCVDIKRPIPKIDQTFYYRCLSAVSKNNVQKMEIKDLDFRETVRFYLEERPAGYVPADSSNIAAGIFQNASQQMATMAKNSTSMEFWRRCKRYLKSKYDVDGKRAYEMARDIRSKDYDGEDPIVRKYRSMLPSSRTRNVEDRPELVMPLQILFLRHFEKRLADEREAAEREELDAKDNNQKTKGRKIIDKKCRLFSLLPTKNGFGCGHIKLCSTGLYGLLKRSEISDMPKSIKLFLEQASIYWNQYFDISKFEFGQTRFAHEIVTDGKSVSILFRKPKREDVVLPIPNLQDFQQVWGLDPGRREVFVASSIEGELARWSSKRYYHEAGFKRSGNKIRGWQERDVFINDTMATMPTKKSAHVSKLMEYSRFMLARLDQMLTFGMAKRMRDLKFGRYIGKQKAINYMCKALTGTSGRNTLVGFGDWSNKDSAGIIKKSPAGPVKAFERELRRRCRVISIDEFRSSKLHECCHQPMKNMYCEKQFFDKKTNIKETKTSKIHSVLLCGTRGCKGIRVNRDVNASRNMLMLLKEQLLGRRPAAFSRQKTPETDPLSPDLTDQPGEG